MDTRNTTNIGTVKVLMLKGETGNSIATIEKTATTATEDTYTITLTDGSTQTFSVAVGTGITSIEKTATVDLVDTYTITFADGTTTTFDVTNGQSYTVPTDGVIYFDGETLPEGYEETDPPPQFKESITEVVANAGLDQVIQTEITITEVTT